MIEVYRGIHGDAVTYLLFQNVKEDNMNRFLHVRLGAAPDLSKSSLHALVGLHVGGRCLVRRVESPGAQDCCGSMRVTVANART